MELNVDNYRAGIYGISLFVAISRTKEDNWITVYIIIFQFLTYSKHGWHNFFWISNKPLIFNFMWRPSSCALLYLHLDFRLRYYHIQLGIFPWFPVSSTRPFLASSSLYEKLNVLKTFCCCSRHWIAINFDDITWSLQVFFGFLKPYILKLNRVWRWYDNFIA